MFLAKLIMKCIVKEGGAIHHLENNALEIYVDFFHLVDIAKLLDYINRLCANIPIMVFRLSFLNAYNWSKIEIPPWHANVFATDAPINRTIGSHKSDAVILKSPVTP